jgi:GntR family transcriptional regulator
MFFRFEPVDGVPIYVGLINQIKYAIASGALKPGDELPSVRELAKQQRINPNTAARVYRELEHEGVVETRRGQGTFVAEKARAVARPAKERIVSRLLEQALAEAYHLGMSVDDVRQLLDKCAGSLEKKRTVASRAHSA